MLRPGGTVRLITPDAEQYLVGYAALRSDPAAESLPRAQGDRYHGEYTPAMSVNRVFGQPGGAVHLWLQERAPGAEEHLVDRVIDFLCGAFKAPQTA